MNQGDIVQLIGVGTLALAVLVPVIGVTVRLALGPLIKARRLAATPPPPDLGHVDARMDAIEDEVRRIGEGLNRLAAAAEFDAQLRAPAGGETPRLPQPGSIS